MGVSGQRHAPAALYPEKDPRYPLDRKLGGPQSYMETDAGGKSLLIETRSCTL
jgi:hypothetical protein